MTYLNDTQLDTIHRSIDLRPRESRTYRGTHCESLLRACDGCGRATKRHRNLILCHACEELIASGRIGEL